MARARGAVEARLDEFLRDRRIGYAEALGVAYSGGPDSTALLAALCSLRPGSAVAVHVDHGLRGAAERAAERELCVRSCKALGCPLTIATIAPLSIRRAASGSGVEAAAREYRYRALRVTMRRRSLKRMLMAHTLDDQAETLLMRLFGGSGAAGLRGIPEERGPYLRPFLALAKKEILEYLEARGLEYSIDSTNASDDYLRNRARSILIPALDSAFPGWRRGLARTSRAAALDEEALAAAAERSGFSARGGGGLEAGPELLSSPDAVAARAIVSAAGELQGRGRFPWRAALAALRALRSGERASYEGAGLRLSREGPVVALGLDFPACRGYFVRIDGPCRVRAGSMRVAAAWTSGSGIRADSFRFPLVLRSRRPGDCIASGNGAKRVDELLSEWAVPRAKRDSVTVVEDAEGIVAVLASTQGGKDRYRAGPTGGLVPEENGARRLAVIVKGA